MTKAEYEAKYSKVKNTTVTGGFSAHKSAVETAINQGKPVPAKVLKDYPELKGSENTMDTTTSKERAEMGRNAYGCKTNSEDKKENSQGWVHNGHKIEVAIDRDGTWVYTISGPTVNVIKTYSSVSSGIHNQINIYIDSKVDTANLKKENSAVDWAARMKEKGAPDTDKIQALKDFAKKIGVPENEIDGAIMHYISKYVEFVKSNVEDPTKNGLEKGKAVYGRKDNAVKWVHKENYKSFIIEVFEREDGLYKFNINGESRPWAEYTSKEAAIARAKRIIDTILKY